MISKNLTLGLSLVIFLATLFFLTPKSFATADGPDSYRVTGVAANDVLNLREKPSAQAKILAKIPPNAHKLENMVHCVGRKGETIPDSDAPPPESPRPYWCKIKYKGIEDWVPIRYLREE